VDLDQQFLPGQLSSGEVVVLVAGLSMGCHLPAPGLEMPLAGQGLFRGQKQVHVSHDPKSGISGRRCQQVNAPLQDDG
jgi:hypothetical protein